MCTRDRETGRSEMVAPEPAMRRGEMKRKKGGARMKRSAKQRPVLKSALAEGEWTRRMRSTCMLLTKNTLKTALDEEANVGDVKGGRGGGLS